MNGSACFTSVENIFQMEIKKWSFESNGNSAAWFV